MSISTVIISSAASAPVGQWIDTGPISGCQAAGTCQGRAAVLLEGPQCRANPALTFCGKVLLVGTWPPPAPVGSHTTELYNPAANSWTPATPAAPTIESRSSPGAVQIDGPECDANPTTGACGKVLVVGGNSYDNPDTAELYDPATNTWSSTHPLLFSHYQWFSMVLLEGPRCGTLCGDILVAAGANGGTKSEVYDPGRNTWAATGSLVTSRAEHVAAYLDGPECATASPPGYCGDVLVAGGRIGNPSSPTTATAELFDPTRVDGATGLVGAWRPTASLAPDGSVVPYAPELARASVLTGPRCGSHCGQVLVAGGVGIDPTTFASDFYSTAELYDPAVGSWTPTASLSTPRADPAGILLTSGDYLVAGGYASSIPPTTAEVYDPAAGSWSLTAPITHTGFSFAAALLAPGPSSECAALCGRALVTGANMDVAEIFEGPPAVGSVALSPVPLAGAATALNGGGFTTASQVTIDGVPIACPSPACTHDPNNPDVTLDVTLPPHAKGNVTLVVHNEVGDSPPFVVQYADLPPTLTALSPACGPVAGGTAVAISGSYFTPSSWVDFGGTRTAATVISEGAIEVTSPAAFIPAGVSVKVETSVGTSAPLTFTYPCSASSVLNRLSAAGFAPPTSYTGVPPPTHPGPPPAAQPPPASALTAAPHAPASSPLHGGLSSGAQATGGIAGVAHLDEATNAPALLHSMVQRDDWGVSPGLAVSGAVLLSVFVASLYGAGRKVAGRDAVVACVPADVGNEEVWLQ